MKRRPPEVAAPSVAEGSSAGMPGGTGGDSPDEQLASTLLAVVRTLLHEIHPGRRGLRVELDSRLERELGFDSLGRAELKLRVEQEFGVMLPESVLVTAESPRDMLRAVLSGRKPGAVTAERSIRDTGEQPDIAAPSQAGTLVDVLNWHVQAHPDRVHVVSAGEDGGEKEITYGGLMEQARCVAAGLLERGLPPRSPVAIMLPTGPDYFYSFFGSLLAGGIPVPIYPPARLALMADHMRRHAGILGNAGASVLITYADARGAADELCRHVGGLRIVATPDELAAGGPTAAGYAPRPDDIAFLQYTSGSTGEPKGVVLTHANLIANVKAIGEAVDAKSSDVIVSWLPLYHDMGLIGAWFGSLYFGARLVSRSPLSFLARPQSWLWAIHRHRGTLSAAPNFAYELCARKIDDRALTDLDLGSWRVACNGAEPVSAPTIEAFVSRFARHGFRREAMTPVYGLAENSVGLTFPPLGRGPRIDRINRRILADLGRAEPAAESDEDALCVVGCGHPLEGHEVRIVDPHGREVGDREQGLLQFKGPSASPGYYRNPEETGKLMAGEWRNSGDYAYLANGEVHVTGRAKDMIIRAGRNIHPHECEEAVGRVAGIRAGSVAIFGSPDRRTGVERIVVMAETRETDAAARASLEEKIRTVVLDLIGTPPDDVALVRPQTVLKTSSGKIRRRDCRALFERGGHLVSRSWLGMRREQLRLAADRGREIAVRRLAATGHALWGAWAATVAVVLGGAAWIAAPWAGQPRTAWRICRACVRLFLRLSGLRVALGGAERLPLGTPCVVVANHSSYLDAVTLVATMPRYTVFVAKRELEEHPVSRRLLRSLGVQFVERFDVQQGLADANRLQDVVRSGDLILFFPEGTFRRRAGLLPFRLGAFVLAAQRGLPVVPVTIGGTRAVLPDGDWIPRRAGISVEIGEPIRPDGSDWGAAVRLRDAARAEILARCREPDLFHDIAGPPRPAVRGQSGA